MAVRAVCCEPVSRKIVGIRLLFEKNAQFNVVFESQVDSFRLFGGLKRRSNQSVFFETRY